MSVLPCHSRQYYFFSLSYYYGAPVRSTATKKKAEPNPGRDQPPKQCRAGQGEQARCSGQTRTPPKKRTFPTHIPSPFSRTTQHNKKPFSDVDSTPKKHTGRLRRTPGCSALRCCAVLCCLTSPRPNYEIFIVLPIGRWPSTIAALALYEKTPSKTTYKVLVLNLLQQIFKATWYTSSFSFEPSRILVLSPLLCEAHLDSSLTSTMPVSRL